MGRKFKRTNKLKLKFLKTPELTIMNVTGEIRRTLNSN